MWSSEIFGKPKAPKKTCDKSDRAWVATRWHHQPEKRREVAFAGGPWQMPTNPKLPPAKKIQELIATPGFQVDQLLFWFSAGYRNGHLNVCDKKAVILFWLVVIDVYSRVDMYPLSRLAGGRRIGPMYGRFLGGSLKSLIPWLLVKKTVLGVAIYKTKQG